MLHLESNEDLLRQSRSLKSASVLVQELLRVERVLLLLAVPTRLLVQLRFLRLQQLERCFRCAADVPRDLFRDHHDDCGARDLPGVLLQRELP
jgi:hypothetical protein